jgi:uncharacterized repeat protein (TIGR04138 family)
MDPTESDKGAPSLDDYREVSQKCGYSVDAILLVMNVLDYALRVKHGADQAKHITAAEFEAGTKPYAIQEFGLAAHFVLGELGIRDSSCLGKIVFALIEAEFLQKTSEDRIENFDGLGKYGRVDFEAEYREHLECIAFLSAA